MPDEIKQAYIAGLYTDPREVGCCANIARALQAAVKVSRMGYRPIVPHASGDHRVTWEKAMTRCREMVDSLIPSRDLMVLIPGWETSRGACIEKQWAEEVGINVVLYLDLFPEDTLA